ncbi:MAG: zf-TFIIB domain-containing protein [Candidatus Thermoplasmatota archaeon]|nr:zf-TFIIB domain-containing protein [Candidatus Thermoplasmatota archaeon]
MTDFEPEEFRIKSDRECPRCRTELYIVERGGESLDVCSECHGIWFDPRELEGLVGEDSPVELLIRITGSLKGEELLCPVCDMKMVTKEVYDVYVDLCEKCGGTWLDAGETEKVWERDERSRHPFDMQPEVIDRKHFWDKFRTKYQGFDTNKGQ